MVGDFAKRLFLSRISHVVRERRGRKETIMKVFESGTYEREGYFANDFRQQLNMTEKIIGKARFSWFWLLVSLICACAVNFCSFKSLPFLGGVIAVTIFWFFAWVHRFFRDWLPNASGFSCYYWLDEQNGSLQGEIIRENDELAKKRTVNQSRIYVICALSGLFNKCRFIVPLQKEAEGDSSKEKAWPFTLGVYKSTYRDSYTELVVTDKEGNHFVKNVVDVIKMIGEFQKFPANDSWQIRHNSSLAVERELQNVRKQADLYRYEIINNLSGVITRAICSIHDSRQFIKSKQGAEIKEAMVREFFAAFPSDFRETDDAKRLFVEKGIIKEEEHGVV